MVWSTVNGKPRWGAAAALALLCGAGLVTWWADFGGDLLWLTPVVGVGSLAAAGMLDPRVPAILAILWLPGAILVAGLSPGVLAPAALDTTMTSLRAGVLALPTIGTATPVVQGWALAAVLLIVGSAASLAGLLWIGTAWSRILLGFILLLLAPVGAAALGQAPDAPWQGAVVLVALVLRTARGRLLPIATAATMVGAVALFGAQVAAPRAGWQPFGRDQLPRFHELDTHQTYGPLGDRRTGAVMLDIAAPAPALWRMQVLEAFDNRRWLVAREASHLPEPAARKQTIRVQVRGLHGSLVPSPGQILAVHGAGGSARREGDARGLFTAPHEGETYRVVADAVHTTAARLARIPVPIGRRYEALTEVGLGPPPRNVPYPLARLAEDLPESLRGTDWGRLFRVSYRLSAGVRGELGLVRRVEGYLLQGGRFRYTTDVGRPGAEPLLDFVFHTHAGYCQHFAGAAALILRLAGVPTRVAVGFATGEQIGGHAWAVRDEDAHAWIEVYFPGVGWVPFNPTPPAAPADLAPGLDVLGTAVTPQGGASGSVPLLLGLAAAMVALVAAGRLTRRRSRRPLAEFLVRLAPQPWGPRTTLRNLHLSLTEIGPATAELALVAERARFAGVTPDDPPHPGLTVCRALVADVGLAPALVLMLRAARSPGGT